MRYILVLTLVLAVFSAYSEEDAKRYTWASSYAYCDYMAKNDCGKASTGIKNNGLTLVAFQEAGRVFNFINVAILKDPIRQELIVAFSGTKNPAQLAHEIVGNLPTAYSLHDIKDAFVLSYFASHYAQFSDWLHKTLANIGLNNYKLVITGHSLGGALAVHAATDLVYSGLRPVHKVYTFGQPRVGNKQFDQFLKSKVQDVYRVTHW